MKARILSLFAFLLLAWTATSAYAGISVSSPGVRNRYFTIYYGLGSPQPGKIAYVSVTKPDGSHFTIAQAENVPDYSQVCYLYADQMGTYRFFYEYSYDSQGVPRTVVFYQDYYIASGNNIGWGTVTAPTASPPYSTVTITANFNNSGTSNWGNNHYIEFSDTQWTPQYYASVSGIWSGYVGTRSANVTLPMVPGGTATYHLRGIEANVEYFGPTRDVPIGIDYAPTCSLSVSTTSAVIGSSVTITSWADDAGGNLTTHTIDYQSPDGTWYWGSSSNGTRWDGYGGGSTLQTSVYLNQVGTWTVHSRSFDNYGQMSPAQYQYITVSNPIATTFSFSGGPYTYDGGTKSVSVTPNPSNASYSASGVWSAVNAGTYTATATATGAYTGSQSYTWTIYQASQAAVSVSPSSQSVGLGQSITFTASGGTAGNYIWGGDASGTGSSVTVTFNTAGTRTVTVYRQGDANYSASNSAVATITVGTQNDPSNQNQLNVHLPLLQ